MTLYVVNDDDYDNRCIPTMVNAMVNATRYIFPDDKIIKLKCFI